MEIAEWYKPTRYITHVIKNVILDIDGEKLLDTDNAGWSAISAPNSQH